MNKKLQNQLFEKYPTIFREKDEPENKSCMSWGIECGDGWYDIIDTLCQSFMECYQTGFRVDPQDQNIVDGETFFTVLPPKVIATQVKEKFGILRFYYRLEYDERLNKLEKTDRYPDIKEIKSGYNFYIDGMVHFAEILTSKTCEFTGKVGEIHVSGGSRGGWYKVLNRDYAKTDPKFVERGYVPVADLPKRVDNYSSE